MKERNQISFSEPRVFLVLLSALLVAIVLFYCIVSMITSVGYNTSTDAKQSVPIAQEKKQSITIVLDAGHGGEDPGAVTNNLIEKELNLSIVSKLAEFFKLTDYRVVLTRSDDRLLYNNGEESRKKYYDLYNRLKIAESYESSVFVSIHMNKFPLESCKGLQSFYSMNNTSSKLLAESIQSVSKLLLPDNQRLAKSDEGQIYLLKHLQVPAVLVECGFLSNSIEANLLCDEDYQRQLAFILFCGISNFIKEYEVENQLRM